jgi:hypothetical protein
MPLLYSPIQDKPISALGIESGVYDPSCVARANAGIYFSCMAALSFGKRDLLPVVWAWSHAVNMSNLENDFEKGTVKSACTVLRFFVQNILEDNVNPIVKSDSGDEVNVCELALKILSLADCGAVGAENILSTAMTMLKAPKQAFECFAVLSKLGFLGSIISETGYALFSEDASLMETVEYGYKEISSVAGVDFTRFPAMASKGFKNLKGASNMNSVWHSMSSEVGCLGASRIIRDFSGLEESAEDTMSRRWKSGIAPAFICRNRDFANSSTVENVMVRIGSYLKETGADIDQIRESLDVFVETVHLVSDTLENYYPITFMPKKAYEEFYNCGHTKTIWDLEKECLLGDTWHLTYTDDPMGCRAITDRRLWGEKAHNTVYAALIAPSMRDVVSRLADNYGTVMVEWDEKVFDYSTLTINDSMSAEYSIPATKDNRVKCLVPWVMSRIQAANTIHRGLSPVVQKASFNCSQWINYIEVQIHSRLTTDDVANLIEAKI